MIKNYHLFLIVLVEDSIDVTNDEEPERESIQTLAIPSFVSHPLYGHTQVIFLLLINIIME